MTPDAIVMVRTREDLGFSFDVTLGKAQLRASSAHLTKGFMPILILSWDLCHRSRPAEPIVSLPVQRGRDMAGRPSGHRFVSLHAGRLVDGMCCPQREGRVSGNT